MHEYEQKRSERTFLEKYSEWIFRCVLLLAVFAQLWLTRNFVTRGEFEMTSSQNITDHLGIKTSILDMASTLKIMAVNQTRLDDHEARIRLLENRQIENISRVSALERAIQYKNN